MQLCDRADAAALKTIEISGALNSSNAAVLAEIGTSYRQAPPSPPTFVRRRPGTPRRVADPFSPVGRKTTAGVMGAKDRKLVQDTAAFLLNVSSSVMIIFVNKQLMNPAGYGFRYGEKISALPCSLCATTMPAPVCMRNGLF